MRRALLAVWIIALAGCETMVAPRYSVTGDNNLAVKALGVTNVGVGDFTGPAAFDSNCRLLGPLQAADGLTHTQYIRKAFEEEFKIGGIYAAATPSVVLTGQVTQMEFSSTRGVTGGVWTIALTLTSSNGRKMSAAENYEFPSGFAAPTACKQTAEAFAPAVQNLVGKFVRSPEFAAMVRAGAALSGRQRVDAAFWNSLRASSNPADFRAYLEQFPNGMYAQPARERLAALQPAPAAAIPQKATATRMPQAGDTWTYRLREPTRADGPKERSYSIKVASADAGGIVEHYAVDGGPAGEWTHKGERQLLGLGKSVFAPYLLAFGEPPSSSLGLLEILDCGMTYICEATARVIGWEKVTVPAGVFDALKVEVRQEWRPVAMMGPTGAQLTGGRNLFVWYARETKRAIKFYSRTTFGQIPPIDPDFELELADYRLN
jgi:hypothetical protein